MKTLSQSIEKEKSPGFRKAYEEEQVFADIAIQIAREREKLGISQKEMARLLNTKQQVVSRYEKPGYNFTVRTLCKIAQIFNKELHIDII